MEVVAMRRENGTTLHEPESADATVAQESFARTRWRGTRIYPSSSRILQTDDLEETPISGSSHANHMYVAERNLDRLTITTSPGFLDSSRAQAVCRLCIGREVFWLS